MEDAKTDIPATDARVTGRSIIPYRTCAEEAPSSLELYLDFSLEKAAGTPRFIHRNGVYVRIADSRGRLRAPLIACELKHFWSDVNNYDYLPEEDMAIHRSVSQFVDKAHRVRATKKNCYVRREGLFLPVLLRRGAPPAALAENIPLFQASYDDRRRFLEYSEEKDMNDYLVHVLSSLDP